MGQEAGFFTAESASHQLTWRKTQGAVHEWHHIASGVHASLNQCWLGIPSILNSTKKKVMERGLHHICCPQINILQPCYTSSTADHH